ncbi:MAG: transposase [Kiritimatiellae bacterium]|nr:transposase [Kiritimatiellia bacterium]
MQQIRLPLFYNLQQIIRNSDFHRKYDLLFQSLDLSAVRDTNTGIGRTGFSRHAMLRAFIVKHLEGIKSVPRLIEFLDAHPVLTEMCGFDMGNLPDASQFYKFLTSTNTSVIETLHHAVNQKLIDADVVSLSHFIMDSKPVMAATSQNNFKNPHRNTRNKYKLPKRNLSATLSYYSYQQVDGKKDNFIFFWGYRTHVIVSKEGIPLVSVTLSNNATDATTARKLIKKLKRLYRFRKGAFFIADAAYDERDFYNFIVNQFHGRAFIPINPRNQQAPKTLGPHGCPLCDAGLEMSSCGTWTEGLRQRAKFRCPIRASAKVAFQFPDGLPAMLRIALQAGCPIHHFRFAQDKAYGCTKYLDITDDPRARIPRDSAFFKQTFNLRTEVERYFARLGDREVEQTTHYKMRAIRNQMTIAHLSMSLIAYAAAILLDQPEKIRCFRTFAVQEPRLALTG